MEGSRASPRMATVVFGSLQEEAIERLTFCPEKKGGGASLYVRCKVGVLFGWSPARAHGGLKTEHCCRFRLLVSIAERGAAGKAVSQGLPFCDPKLECSLFSRLFACSFGRLIHLPTLWGGHFCPSSRRLADAVGAQSLTATDCGQRTTDLYLCNTDGQECPYSLNHLAASEITGDKGGGGAPLTPPSPRSDTRCSPPGESHHISCLESVRAPSLCVLRRNG